MLLTPTLLLLCVTTLPSPNLLLESSKLSRLLNPTLLDLLLESSDLSTIPRPTRRTTPSRCTTHMVYGYPTLSRLPRSPASRQPSRLLALPFVVYDTGPRALPFVVYDTGPRPITLSARPSPR